MCASHPLSSFNFSIAFLAVGFVAALMLRAIKTSSKSRFNVFTLKVFFLRPLIDSIILGGNKCVSSDIPANSL